MAIAAETYTHVLHLALPVNPKREGMRNSMSAYKNSLSQHVCIGNSLSQPLSISLPHVYLVPCLNP